MSFKIRKPLLISFVLILTLLGGLFGVAPHRHALAAPGDTTLISLGSLPSPLGANNYSYNPSISADGRYVAFESVATNLVGGDTNGKQDIFVFDRQAGLAERVSVDSLGVEGNNNSLAPSISADGRYVAFQSDASNLVSGDTNNGRDIFIHDLQTRVTERVSTVSTGSGDSGYIRPALSADGHYVAFGTAVSGLVGGDTNGMEDIFVFDCQTSITERVSIGLVEQANYDSYYPSISADGRYVAFGSGASNLVSGDTNGEWDVFVYDRQMDVTELVSVDSSGAQANDSSSSPSISVDGRYVAFTSSASNLVSGDTNSQSDIFVHDRQTHMTERVSIHSNGAQGDWNSYAASISADGRYVSFASYASTLVDNDTNGKWDVFVHDLQTDTTEHVSIDASGAEGNANSDSPSISADGRYVAFESAASLVSGDLNYVEDIFVHDRTTHATEPISVGPVGMGANQGSYDPFISADGRYVSFLSSASNLVSGDTNRIMDVFVHDRQTGVMERVSVASDGAQTNGSSNIPSLSSDGRYVAFESIATNLVTGDTNSLSDIFVHDRQTHTTARVSIGPAGVQANSSSRFPAISADGRYIVFESFSSNLVPGDTGVGDVFIHDYQTGVTERVSIALGGALPNNLSESPSVSSDGRYVAFRSRASNLVTSDTNNAYDIFIFDRQNSVTELVSVASDGTQGNNASSYPSISGDGRYVSFVSAATNLVPGDTNGVEDIFVHDRQTGVTARVSVDSSGVGANASSGSPAISADGRYITFSSSASNLVSGDTNGTSDIFIYNYHTGVTERVTVDSSGVQANGVSGSPSISANGQFVTFTSGGSNLVEGDNNYVYDIFVHENDSLPQATHTIADFDGDGDSDLSVFKVEPWAGMWYLQGIGAHAYGNSASIPVSCDYNGDGTTDVAVYNAGTWYVKDQFVDNWGDGSSVPVPGDYDGDGSCELAVFKVEPWAGMWYIKDIGAYAFGNSTSIPVPADYNNDGTTDIAVYNAGTWYVKDQFVDNWGDGSSIPLPGDYDGNGTTDLAVFKVEPWAGMWYIKDQQAHAYGNAESIPVPADYNGDGRTDVAVYNAGTWYVKDLFVDNWGDGQSFPLPARDTNGDGDPYQ